MVSPPGPSTLPEAEIIAFQRATFPQRDPDLIPARWQWMFVDSARRLGRKPLVWLHRDGDAIVAHMGSIPVRLKIGNQESDTGWLVDTMVLPEYRSRALGSRLMVEAHESQPPSLSLGQTAEMREICLKLGWRQIAPLQIAQQLVRPENVLKSKLPAPAAFAAGLGLRASAGVRDLLADRRRLEAFGDARCRWIRRPARSPLGAGFARSHMRRGTGRLIPELEICGSAGTDVSPPGASQWTGTERHRGVDASTGR
jgi:hypothetical protein